MRPTLRQLFVFSLLCLIASLSFLFYLVFKGSQRTILESGEHFRATASQEIVEHVTRYLNQALDIVEHFEMLIDYGIVDPKNAASIQAGLVSLLLESENVSELSFTYGDSTGFDRDGNIRLIQSSIGQIIVFRPSAGKPDERLIARRVWFDGTKFVSESNILTPAAHDKTTPIKQASPITDPTAHSTFQTPASRDFSGQLLWTDLHWSQLDEALPVDQRRVEVSVQKSIRNETSKFAGVLRVGLLKEQLDRALQLHLAMPNEVDPHLIFLCDNQGQLVTGFGKNQHVAEVDGNLRIVESDLPPQIAEALRQPSLKEINRDHPVSATTFRVQSITYLCTFRVLPETQDWIVGIVVPRDYYLGPLVQIWRRIFWISLGLMIGIISVGALILRGVERAHDHILRETSRMNMFEFSASDPSSKLNDVEEVLTSLERAKTAMRAMSKYVPVDLVRRLYRDAKEPVLGGKSIDLSVLFTDIKDFTSFSEQIPPERLAKTLGSYLQVMAITIQNERGTIDKYIGDAVMAFWNAPEIVEDHTILACHATLKCKEALQELYNSPEWRGIAPFETRFGLHRCVASVGHYGAPNRFNYTAVGDGINLTSRLEGLNKYYGTTIIVSETVYSVAKEQFEFRRLDRVSVKGKTQGITIYELIARKESNHQRPLHIERYEEAFEAYQKGDFKTALRSIEMEVNDIPSQILASRCKDLLGHPPTSDWDGVHIFTTK